MLIVLRHPRFLTNSARNIHLTSYSGVTTVMGVYPRKLRKSWVVLAARIRHVTYHYNLYCFVIIPICCSDSRHHINIRPTKRMSLNMFIHCLINHHLSPMNVAGMPYFLTMLQKHIIQLVMCQRMY